MSLNLTAAIVAAVGVLIFIALFIFLLWFCIFRPKNLSRTSETGSSDPSTQEGRNVAIELSVREAKRYVMEELAQATKGFTNKNLIGLGKFGEVYKGLLQDGVIVAIKKRPGLPTQEFVNEVFIDFPRSIFAYDQGRLKVLEGPVQFFY